MSLENTTDDAMDGKDEGFITKGEVVFDLSALKDGLLRKGIVEEVFETEGLFLAKFGDKDLSTMCLSSFKIYDGKKLRRERDLTEAELDLIGSASSFKNEEDGIVDAGDQAEIEQPSRGPLVQPSLF